MSDIGSMVAELIAAGCSPDVAASVVAKAYVAGVGSAEFRGIPVDEKAEKRRAYDRDRKRKDAEIRRNSTESTGIPILPLSTSNSSINKKESKRGTRLPSEWKVAETDRDFARQLGWPDEQIDRESENFRDYWIARPGAGGLKLDWPATWRKWIRSSKSSPSARPTTVHQQRQLESKEALDALRNASRRANFGVQRHDPGNGQGSVHSGVRGAIIDLSAARDREGHEPVERSPGDGRLSELGKVSGAS